MTHFSLFRQVCQNFFAFYLLHASLAGVSLRFQQSLKLYTGKIASVKFFEIFYQFFAPDLSTLIASSAALIEG